MQVICFVRNMSDTVALVSNKYFPLGEITAAAEVLQEQGFILLVSGAICVYLQRIFPLTLGNQGATFV